MVMKNSQMGTPRCSSFLIWNFDMVECDSGHCKIPDQIHRDVQEQLAWQDQYDPDAQCEFRTLSSHGQPRPWYAEDSEDEDSAWPSRTVDLSTLGQGDDAD
jgi:hypothetical protein